MTNNDIQTLKEIWEFFDGIADGAPDASYAAKMALRFSEPLKQIINDEERDPAQRELTRAAATGSDRIWDETVVRLREQGLLPPI